MMEAQGIYRPAYNKYLEMVDAGHAPEAAAHMAGTLLPAFRTYCEASENLLLFNARNAAKLSDDVAKSSEHTTTTTILGGLIALAFGALVGSSMVGGIRKVISGITEQLNSGADQTAAAAGQV